MPIFKEKRFRDKLAWVLIVVIFLLDVSLPHQFNLASNYLLAIFLGIYSRQKKDVVLLAILSTVLTLVGALLQPRIHSLEEVLAGRIAIILSFWPAAYFVIRFIIDNTNRKNYEDSILTQQEELTNLTSQLRELNETLEHKVGERTEELEQAKNHLAQALNKERELGELKSRFVSMASHEFRTPLSAVLSSASLITSYADRNDIANVKKHSDRIKNSVNGLNTILTEFLSLGKLEEGHIRPKLEPVNLPGAVRDVVTEMKNLFKTGQTFLHSHEGGDEIRIDPGLLKNILINLISNAIKYSPDQGRIMVETTVENGTARLSVRDQGIGIPDDEQRHLFDRFFRATNATNIHGTGLGLYIVRRYVEMLDGQIGFNSHIHKGSEFWVEFPVEPHDEGQPPA
jgi:signal transduction histidine kinase